MDSANIKNQQNFKVNDNSKNIQLSKGQTVRLTVLKLIDNNTFQVNIKGKLFNAYFQSPPKIGKMSVKILETDPFLKMKVVEESDDKVKANSFKKFLAGFKKSGLIEILKNVKQLNLKNADKENVLKLLKNSGIFFENKLSKNIDVSGDLKLEAFKSSENHLTNSITRVQIMNLLAGIEQYFIFHSSEHDISEGELIVKKHKGKYGFSVRMVFSNIGDVIINLIDRGSFIDAVIRADANISEYIDDMSIEGVRVRFSEISDEDYDEFRLEDKAASMIKNLNVLA